MQIIISILITNHVTDIKSIDWSTLLRFYQRVIEHIGIALIYDADADDATSRRMRLCNSRNS